MVSTHPSIKISCHHTLQITIDIFMDTTIGFYVIKSWFEHLVKTHPLNAPIIKEVYCTLLKHVGLNATLMELL
jgi:hypothetical protein